MFLRKYLPFVVLFGSLGVVAALIVVRILNSQKPSAGLKIDTDPPSIVFMNNTQIGRTPIDSMYPAGEINLRLVPESDPSLSPFQTRVTLVNGVYTVIKRKFASSDTMSSGDTIALMPQSAKTASLAVISDPDSASVLLDSQPQGFTPLTINPVSPTEHQIEISAPGYASESLSFKAVSGYKLQLNVKLSASSTPAPTPSLNLSPTSSPSASLETEPTASKPYVRISSTPTGFLRVRSAPSKAGEEIGKVNPGETYHLLSSDNGWYEISVQLTSTTSGWISEDYAQLFK